MRDEPAESAEPRRRELASVDGIRTVSEETAQKLIRTIEGSDPVRRIRGSQLATALLGAVGFALFVVGVERAAGDIPIIENEWGSIVVGLVLLAITGALLRRLGGP
jgi:hypothetical protein